MSQSIKIFIMSLLVSFTAAAQVAIIPTLKDNVMRTIQRMDHLNEAKDVNDSQFKNKLQAIENLKNQIFFELVPKMKNIATKEEKSAVAEFQSYLQIIQSDKMNPKNCSDVKADFLEEKGNLNGESSWGFEQSYKIFEKLCGK